MFSEERGKKIHTKGGKASHLKSPEGDNLVFEKGTPQKKSSKKETSRTRKTRHLLAR